MPKVKAKDGKNDYIGREPPRDKRRIAGRRTKLLVQLGKERQIRAITASALLPHEWLWMVARKGFIVDVLAPGEELIIPLSSEERVSAAKSAAPFYAPRLSHVDVTQQFSEAELLALILADPSIFQTIIGLAAQAGCDVGAIAAAATPAINGTSARVDRQADGAVDSDDPGQ